MMKFRRRGAAAKTPTTSVTTPRVHEDPSVVHVDIEQLDSETRAMYRDAKAAQENADIVAQMAKMPWAGFGAGTDKGAPTKAQPGIWTEQAKFKDHADKLEAESVKLAAAARTGSLDTLKTAFGATAGTCKACHDNYRAK